MLSNSLALGGGAVLCRSSLYAFGSAKRRSAFIFSFRFFFLNRHLDVGSETKTEGKVKERHVFWRSQNHTSTGDTTRPHAKQKRTPSFFTRVFRFDFVAISYHHGSALQRPGARQHPEDEPRRGVGEQGPWKPLGRPPGGCRGCIRFYVSGLLYLLYMKRNTLAFRGPPFDA